MGTFTGEIERNKDPISTARKKCLLAMELNNCDLGIASEGSFGPHPTLFFAPSDDETLVFIDKKNGVEIVERELSTTTNFDAEEIRDQRQLVAFASRANFPDHGLILRKSKEDLTEIVKGITNWTQLNSSFDDLHKKYGIAYIETDMRAMFNPTRMRVIETATQKLIKKITSFCPQCNFPGFGIAQIIPGLPCKLCGTPTRSTLSDVYACQKCSFTKEGKYPTNTLFEDPTYCDNCNP